MGRTSPPLREAPPRRPLYTARKFDVLGDTARKFEGPGEAKVLAPQTKQGG